MSDPEITALREVIAKRVRSDDIGQRRRDIDERQRLQAAGGCYRQACYRQRAGGVDIDARCRPIKAILYLHGGGYVVGSLDSHRHVAAEAGRAARARTLALDYRLAPEHPFPGGRTRSPIANSSCGRH
jgi:acetyl esterase/lipase